MAEQVKLDRLAAARKAVRAAAGGDGEPADPVLLALRDTATRFPLPLLAFEELIDGVEMDVRGRRYATFDELIRYCRCVAGSIGRLCLGVFGCADMDAAMPLADALGIALQQTNILRDIREDLVNGRVYLPAEDLDRFGVVLRLTADGEVAGPRGPPARARGLRGRARRRLVPNRACTAADARPAQRRLLRGHVGHLPPSARPDCRRPRGGVDPPAVPGRLAKDHGCDPGVGRDAGMNGPARPSGAAGRVVVVGGGLAGITAALGCADAGLPVTLLETRPRLGGATSSFRRGELTIDNGQHVFLRCCTAYRDLLDRLGTAHLASLQPRLDIPVLAEGGRSARLRRGRLPAPLHLAGSLARYRLISWPERIAFVRAARALQKVDRDDPATDRQSFGGWLTRQGQSLRGDRRRCGTSSEWPRSTPRRPPRPWPRRDGLPDRAAHPRRRGRHRPGPGCRWEPARRRGRPRPGGRGRRGPHGDPRPPLTPMRDLAHPHGRAPSARGGAADEVAVDVASSAPCRTAAPKRSLPGGAVDLRCGCRHPTAGRRSDRQRARRSTTARCSTSRSSPGSAPRPVGVRPHPAVRRAQEHRTGHAVPGRVAVGGRRVVSRPAAALRARCSPRSTALLPRRPGRAGPRLLRDAGACGDLPRSPRFGRAAAGYEHATARSVPGGRVDRDRPACDDGGCRAQRSGCGRRRPGVRAASTGSRSGRRRLRRPLLRPTA